MATILGTTSSSPNWEFKLEAAETAVSAVNNTSTVKISAYIRNIYGSYMQGPELAGYIQGQYFTWNNRGKYISFPKNTWIWIGEKTVTIGHNSDGSKTITISGSFSNDVKPNSGSASGNITLTKIDKNGPTITMNITDITTDSFMINTTANINCENWQYSLNGDNNWKDFSTTIGVTNKQIIESLNPNTEYTIKVRATNPNNGVSNSTSTITVKTAGGLARVKVNGVWKTAIPYVKVNGQWKQASFYIKKVDGKWKITEA